MKKQYYLTTPIFYANGSPHLGHAYTCIISDIIARCMRLLNYDVKFTTGTDEYGQKIEIASKKENMSNVDFVDKNSLLFRNLTKKLNISNDDFIRTTEDRHQKAVKHLIEIMWQKKILYLSKYKGWYSIIDEAFFKKEEIIDGKSPTGSPVEWIEEESIFFSLSQFQTKLLDFYKKNPNFITPTNKMLEVINFVKKGLEDLSVSRKRVKWGIKMPKTEDHVVYVWLDALINYLSVLDYPAKEFKDKYWPCNLHVIGKDILKFHAIYWPAFLMAVNIDLPKKLMVHGWWKKDDSKMSKSLGNILDPIKLIEKFGLDYVRYFLAREIQLGNDGNFSEKSFINRVNSELVNKIGNLFQRTIVLTKKSAKSIIPHFSQEKINNIYQENNPLKDIKYIIEKVEKNIVDLKYNAILEEIILFTEKVNKYLDNNKPWKITDNKEISKILYISLESMRYIGCLLQPFIPTSSQKILDILKINKNSRSFLHLNKKFAIESNFIENTEIIFPRINL